MQDYRTYKEIICIRLGQFCNLNCRGCLSASSPFNERETTDIHKMRKLLTQLKKVGVRKLSYSGGEPLLVKNLGEVIAMGADMGIHQIVTTNGTLPVTLLNRHHLEYIKVSLWGDQAFYGQYFTGKLFERISTTITEALIAEYPIGLNIIVTAAMLPRLNQFLHIVYERWPTIDNVVLHGYLPVDDNDAWRLTDENKQYIKDIINIFKNLSSGISLKYLDLEKMGSTYITVDQNGKLEKQTSASSSGYTVGNIYNLSNEEVNDLLKAMWEHKYVY